MIKVKIVTKKQINEAELAYSIKLNNQIYSFVDDYIKGKHKQNFKMFQVPLLDLLNQKDNILNGAVAFSILNLKKQNLNKLEKFWLADKAKFSFDPKDKLKSVKIPIFVSLDKLDKASARINLFDLDDNDTQIAIEIDPDKHLNKDRLLKVNLKHESQHVTQVVNDLMIKYYNALRRAKNISDIEKINFSIDVKYGLGRKADLSGKDSSYLERNIEYKPWVSMIVDRYINWLFEQKLISDKTIQDNKESINSFAIKLLKRLLEDKNTLKQFGEQTGKKGVLFIELHKNKKQFINEMLKQLEQKLTELI